jgi:hypothetical protein
MTGVSTTDRRPIRNIALRRAVMRVLLRAGRPVRVAEVVQILVRDERVAIADHHASSASQRISNVLAWQVRKGRARRTSRGVYEAIPASIPRTTRWRIECWDDLE